MHQVGYLPEISADARTKNIKNCLSCLLLIAVRYVFTMGYQFQALNFALPHSPSSDAPYHKQ
jgi:hypothetical protein